MPNTKSATIIASAMSCVCSSAVSVGNENSPLLVVGVVVVGVVGVVVAGAAGVAGVGVAGVVVVMGGLASAAPTTASAIRHPPTHRVSWFFDLFLMTFSSLGEVHGLARASEKRRTGRRGDR